MQSNNIRKMLIIGVIAFFAITMVILISLPSFESPFNQFQSSVKKNTEIENLNFKIVTELDKEVPDKSILQKDVTLRSALLDSMIQNQNSSVNEYILDQSIISKLKSLNIVNIEALEHLEGNFQVYVSDNFEKGENHVFQVLRTENSAYFLLKIRDDLDTNDKVVYDGYVYKNYLLEDKVKKM